MIEGAKNIICGCVYRHPSGDIDDFINYVSKCLTKINNEKKECYISGDFNIDLLKYNTNSKYNEFFNTMTSFGFLPHILQPTRITDYSSTVIDNIYGNNFDQESISGNILISFADHFTQFISIKKKVHKLKPKAVYKRDYSLFNENLFIDDLSIQNWNCDNLISTNEKFDDFYWRVEGCVDRHAPLKKLNKKQLNKMSKPWLNNYILKLIRHRDRFHHKKKENPSNQYIKQVYNLFRNRTTREIRKAKKLYYKEYFEKNVTNMKKVWLGIKEIVNLNSKRSLKISHLNYEGKKIVSDEGMANAFNDYFTNIGPKLDQNIPKSKRPDNELFFLNNRILHSFLISPTNPHEIFRSLFRTH